MLGYEVAQSVPGDGFWAEELVSRSHGDASILTHWKTTSETKGVHEIRKSAKMRSVYNYQSFSPGQGAGVHTPQSQLLPCQ